MHSTLSASAPRTSPKHFQVGEPANVAGSPLQPQRASSIPGCVAWRASHSQGLNLNTWYVRPRTLSLSLKTSLQTPIRVGDLVLRHASSPQQSLSRRCADRGLARRGIGAPRRPSVPGEPGALPPRTPSLSTLLELCCVTPCRANVTTRIHGRVSLPLHVPAPTHTRAVASCDTHTEPRRLTDVPH